MKFRDDMQPRVDHEEEKEDLGPVFDENGNEVDVEALIALYNEDPGSLTEEELLYLPDDMFEPEYDATEFGANLANILDDGELSQLADDILQWVDDDKNSRSEWEARMVRGLRFIGTTENTEGGGGPAEDGYSQVVHPGVLEAVTQFQARAIAEVWPASGPVKTQVLGATSQERNAQAQRVREYLNYLYMHKMPEAYEQEEAMETWLALVGSCFKKAYWCPIQQRPVVKFIRPEKLYVPADATDLVSAPHYIEAFDETGNDTIRKIKAGIYREVKLGQPDATSIDRSDLEVAVDESSGRAHTGYFGDQSYRRYEAYVYLVLPGDEDFDDEGEPTGLAKPYIITVDDDSSKVLSIYRGWKENDPQYQRRVYHTHYRFLPGHGFYGHGLLHAIGGLSEAATGALRALLDSATFANLQGGWVSQDVDIRGGELRRKAGVWQKVRASGEDMRNGFFTPPTTQPSAVLFNLLGFLTSQMQRFASTTEVMVGDAANSAPVGTTLAQIEQGSKVFSGIHKRLHYAHMQEYKLVASLVAENIPEGGYPYAMGEGISGDIMAEDFDDRIDVIPVSDPNIVSQDQRIAKAQSTYQLATQHPDLHDLRAVVKNLHIALGNNDVDALMPEPKEAPILDPVSEFAAVLRGEPVQAGPDQDHAAHANFLQQAFAILPAETQAAIEPQFRAIFHQHLGFAVKQQVEAMTGMAAEQVPAEMLAQMQISPIVKDTQRGGSADSEAVRREQDRKDVAAQAKIGLETEKVMGDQRRRDAQAMTRMELDMLAMDSEQQRKDAMTASKLLSDAQTGMFAAEQQAAETDAYLESIGNE